MVALTAAQFIFQDKPINVLSDTISAHGVVRWLVCIID